MDTHREGAGVIGAKYSLCHNRVHLGKNPIFLYFSKAFLGGYRCCSREERRNLLQIGFLKFPTLKYIDVCRPYDRHPGFLAGEHMSKSTCAL